MEVRQHDIRTDPLESDTFDLAHCRTLLMHLPEPLMAVRRMVAALKNGGWLLVEEPEYSSFRAIDAKHPLAATLNLRREILQRMIARSPAYDPYIGCRLRSLLEEAGLTHIGNQGVIEVERGGELHAQAQCASLQAFVQIGVMSQAECAELQKAFSDPTLSFITPTMFAGWGKRAD
jgi:SAM-dependent methyltransferase